MHRHSRCTISAVSIQIGVLAIQGSFAEHIHALLKLGVTAREVRTLEDLRSVDGLIMPGGESTTIGKLLKIYKMDTEIKARASQKKKPLVIWGTCAGAILLAKEVAAPKPDILGLLDIAITRNAYGSQIESFETTLPAPKFGKKPLSAVFIRAPRITRVGKGVEILARYAVPLAGAPGAAQHSDEAVLVQYNNLLASTFHPELTEDLRVHEYFITLTQHYYGNAKKN